MNSEYRQGYRDGLTLAAEHAKRGMKPLDEKGVQRFRQQRYGMRNSKAANSRKVGFRDGYMAGVETAQIERSGVTVRALTDTESGGSGE